MTLLGELKRRNVIRVALAYVAISWLLIQVAETVLPFFGISDDAIRLFIIALGIGFLPALIFSWVFEITPEGIKKEKDVDRSRSVTPQTGTKLDRIIIVVLTLALGFFAVDKFVFDPQRDAARLEQATEAAAEQALEQAAAALPERSIAVLPFVDLSQARDQEYFSDGLAEELLNLLARIRELRVISRSSAFSYKGKGLDIPTIASQLNVRHVLEGSVRKHGDQIRITAQLIDAHNDTQLWSETFDRPMENIFAIQDEISAAVVEKMRVTLLGEIPHAREADPEAYSLYLRGRHMSRTGSAAAYETAINYYEQAVAIDPDYAPAWSGLGALLNNKANQATDDERLRLSREARNAAERAIEADPSLGHAYSVLGWNALVFDGDIRRAIELSVKAVKTSPLDFSAIGNAATLMEAGGLKHKVLPFRRYHAQRAPNDPTIWYNLAVAEFESGNYDECLDAARQSLQLSPDKVWAYSAMGHCLLMQDKPTEALAAYENEPDDRLRLIGIAKAQFALGNVEASDAALEQAIERFGASSAQYYAQVYLLRREFDAAFGWAEQLLADTGNLSIDWKTATFLTPIHSDPRWPDLAERAGLSEDPLEGIDLDFEFPE